MKKGVFKRKMNSNKNFPAVCTFEAYNSRWLKLERVWFHWQWASQGSYPVKLPENNPCDIKVCSQLLLLDHVTTSKIQIWTVTQGHVSLVRGESNPTLEKNGTTGNWAVRIVMSKWAMTISLLNDPSKGSQQDEGGSHQTRQSIE